MGNQRFGLASYWNDAVPINHCTSREMSGGYNEKEKCTVEELRELKERKFRDLDAKEYREEVRRTNQEVFEKEREEREKVREQAKTVLGELVLSLLFHC